MNERKLWQAGIALMAAGLVYAAFQGDTPIPQRTEAQQVRRTPLDKAKSTTTEAMGPPAPEEPPVKLLPTAADAVAMAWADAQTLSPFDLPYVRWIWNPTGAKPSVRAVSLAINYVSRASTIIRPLPLHNGVLLRIDLRWYDPQSTDWLKLWEDFSFDPSFSLLLTKDTINFLAETERPTRKITREVRRVVPGKVTVRREERIIVHPGGDFRYPDDATEYAGKVARNAVPGRYSVECEIRERTPDQEVVGRVVDDVRDLAGVDVVRLNRRDIDPVAMTALQAATHSEAPVVEYRYFLSRALSTVKDKGVYKEIFGGLYYDLRGIKKAVNVKGKEKATDEDLFFENLGIGNVAAGVTADLLFAGLRSDQRVAVFRSGVTGKPRRVDMFHTPAGRETGGWGAITHDLKDQDIDIGTHPVMNLLNFKDAAREAIFDTPNGLPMFALFNGAGVLQDEVPPDVAADATIPSPFTRRLQGAISCIRCHGTDGSDGWKPLTNDVKTLLAGRNANVFGDRSELKKSPADVIDRLAGLYSGDFTKNLRRARDDVAATTLKATGPWEGGEDQSSIAKLAAKELADLYAEQNWTLIDAQGALRRLGFAVPKDKAVQFFRDVCPPDLRADVGGVILEDARVSALHAGLGINPSDWYLVEAFVAERVSQNMAVRLLRMGK